MSAYASIDEIWLCWNNLEWEEKKVKFREENSSAYCKMGILLSEKFIGLAG